VDEPKAKWVIEMRVGKASVFLPTGLQRDRFIEVTQMGEAYAVFYDPETFTTHRCADYRRAAMAEKGLSEP